MAAAHTAQSEKQEKLPLDLRGTLVWGALVGAWLGLVGFAGPSPGLLRWTLALLLGMLIGAAFWALSRRLPRKRRWAARVALVTAVFVPVVVRGTLEAARSNEAAERILQPVPLGATESEIVDLLGPPEKSYDRSDDSPRMLGELDRCDPPRIDRVLVYGPPETGGMVRSLYLDREGRYYCDSVGTLHF